MADILLLVFLLWLLASFFRFLSDWKAKRARKRLERLQDRINDQDEKLRRMGVHLREPQSSYRMDTGFPQSGSYPSSQSYSAPSYTGQAQNGPSTQQNDANRQRCLQYAERLEMEAQQEKERASILQSKARTARQNAYTYTREADQLRQRGDFSGAQSAINSAQHCQSEADAAEQEASRAQLRASECWSQARRQRQLAEE